ncbi:hypothetical protein FB639_002852, partial [Coemansia asiatica]
MQQRQEEQQRRVVDQAQQANQNQNLNQNQNGLGIDFDENFGDLDAADGILEAMGLRGPFFNAIQYFMMLLLIVAVVLSLCVWTPMIIGRFFLALNPMRRLLYLIHLLSLAIDRACELVFDKLMPFVWMLIRPVLTRVVNWFGPFVIVMITPFAPSLRTILSSSFASDSGISLWEKLSSPKVRDLIIKQLREPSSVVQLLFPWISTSVPSYDASDSAASGLSLSLSAGANYLANTAAKDSAASANTFIDGLKQVLDYIAHDEIDIRALDELLSLQEWERELWGRLDDLGIPIYRLAFKLHSIASALTLTDRALLILVGNLVCVYVAWNIVNYMPRQNKRSLVYQVSRMFLLMAKIVYFVFIEVVLFPMLCGYCLDIALTPLIPVQDREYHYWAILNNSLTRRAIFWGIGLVFMLHFARCVSYCRQVARPGLLWFIRDPNDPDFHPMREALEGRTISQQTKIWRSAIMYCGTLFVCLGLPSYAATLIAPNALPMKYDEAAWADSFPRRLHLAVMLLVMTIRWGKPYALARVLLSFWWKVAARMTRLSEFILGTRDVLDEGRWVVCRYPQMPVILPRLWMPTHVVTEAFEELNTQASDRARDGEKDDAIPTSEFKARLQQRIDVALMQRYPWVDFVLDGQNIRAPAIDTVSVVPGRKMLVPVDDQGRPIEDKYDYEAADYPERRQAGDSDSDNDNDPGQRDLPPAAPESSFRDLRFKPMQHKVIYVPPRLRMRVIAFIAMMWLLVSTIFVAAVVSSMLAGKELCARVGDMPRNDYIIFAVGLLSVIALSTSLYQIGCLLAALFNRDGSLTWILREAGRQIYRAWITVWKLVGTTFFFFGFLPALYGLVFEIYIVVVLRAYLVNKEVELLFARTSMQAVKFNWLISTLYVWGLVSALRLFPNTRLARAVDRRFTGPPHTWQVWRGIVDIGIPAAGLALLISALPFVVTLLQLWIQGKLTFEKALQVLFLKDIKLLARNSMIITMISFSLALVWWACMIYKRWSRLARDRVYLVGQQLHNIDDDHENNNNNNNISEVDGAQANGNVNADGNGNDDENLPQIPAI